MSNRLSISVILPEESSWRRLELRFLIDGRDVVGGVFDKGPGQDPDRLLGPDSALLAPSGPMTVRLAEAECTWGCCGCIDVRIRREGDEIVWDQWSNPDVREVPLGEFRFIADQYEAELQRATEDRTWEWPGRTIARLVKHALDSAPETMAIWDSSLDFTGSLPDRRFEVEVVFTSPPLPVVHAEWDENRRQMEYRQFQLRFPVTDAPAQDQADDIVAVIRADDPRDSAEICGGYRASRPGS